VNFLIHALKMKTLTILIGLFRLARNPSDYVSVENFREILRRYNYFAICVQKVNELSETKAIMNAKPMLNWNSLNFETFEKLPPETLGYQFRKFLQKSHLQPLNYSRDTTLSDEEFLIRRVVQTHDIWHVVLGYETDELGEIGINSFALAQIGWPPAGFYIGGYTLKQMLKAPHKVSEVISVVAEGWRRGRAARPLFAVHWETQFQRPVAEIRKELGVT